MSKTRLFSTKFTELIDGSSFLDNLKKVYGKEQKNLIEIFSELFRFRFKNINKSTKFETRKELRNIENLNDLYEFCINYSIDLVNGDIRSHRDFINIDRIMSVFRRFQSNKSLEFIKYILSRSYFIHLIEKNDLSRAKFLLLHIILKLQLEFEIEPPEFYEGIILAKEGNLPQAKEKLRKSESILLDRKNYQSLAHLYNHLGIIYGRQGEFPKARYIFEETVKLAKKIGNDYECARAFNNLSIVENHNNRHDKAKMYLIQAIDISKDQQYEGLKLAFLSSYAKLNLSTGNYKGAIELYTEVLEMRETRKEPLKIQAILSDLGICYAKIGELDKAFKNYFRSLQYFQGDYKSDEYLVSLINLADLSLQISRFEEAFEFISQAERINEKNQSSFIKGKVALIKAKIFLYKNKYDKTEFLLSKAESCAIEMEESALLYNTRFQMAKLFLKTGKYKKSLELLNYCLKKNKYSDDHVQESEYLIRYLETLALSFQISQAERVYMKLIKLKNEDPKPVIKICTNIAEFIINRHKNVKSDPSEVIRKINDIRKMDYIDIDLYRMSVLYGLEYLISLTTNNIEYRSYLDEIEQLLNTSLSEMMDLNMEYLRELMYQLLSMKSKIEMIRKKYTQALVYVNEAQEIACELGDQQKLLEVSCSKMEISNKMILVEQ